MLPIIGERTLLGVENMLGSIAVPEPFSLELAGDVDGVTLMARCLDDQFVGGAQPGTGQGGRAAVGGGR